MDNVAAYVYSRSKGVKHLLFLFNCKHYLAIIIDQTNTAAQYIAWLQVV